MSGDWLDAWRYIATEPLGEYYVAVTSWAEKPLLVTSVCRSDIGQDFRQIDPPAAVSPGRTLIIDVRGLTLTSRAVPPAWPVLDPNFDYSLVAEFSYYNNGVEWRLGTGPDNDLGPLYPRPVLGDLP